MKLQHKYLMLSDVEKGNNLMLTKLIPVATLVRALKAWARCIIIIFTDVKDSTEAN